MEHETKQYPEGHFLGMWMAIGIVIFSGLGIPLSIVTGNPGLMGIGPALGVAIGLSIGQAVENKYKQEGKIRPLSQAEQKRKKLVLTLGIIFLVLGVLLSLLLLFL